jgi:hypothetical protein
VFGKKRSPPHATPASVPSSAARAHLPVRARRIGPRKKSIYTRVNAEVSDVATQRHNKTENKARLADIENLTEIERGLLEMEQVDQERQRLRQGSSLEKTQNRVGRALLWWLLLRSILITLAALAAWGYEFAYSLSHHDGALTISGVIVGVCSGVGVVVYRLARRKSDTIADILKDVGAPPETPEDLFGPAAARTSEHTGPRLGPAMPMRPAKP